MIHTNYCDGSFSHFLNLRIFCNVLRKVLSIETDNTLITLYIIA